jgi:uncharacterized RDD family membrane protein YckC
MCVAYEGVILFGVVFFFAYAFSALTQYKGQSGMLRNVFQAFMFCVLGMYFVWFWSKGRRTLPMKTMGVTLVDQAGAPAGRGRALVRYLAASAGWACRWHWRQVFAGTIVRCAPFVPPSSTFSARLLYRQQHPAGQNRAGPGAAGARSSCRAKYSGCA